MINAYNVQVRAYTNAGHGPWSAAVETRTAESGQCYHCLTEWTLLTTNSTFDLMVLTRKKERKKVQ